MALGNYYYLIVVGLKLKAMLFIIVLLLVKMNPTAAACYTSIFAFGDSLTDVGNKVIFSKDPSRMTRLPYGETFFHHPNGRSCDGRLFIDFVAEYYGVPFMPPYGSVMHDINRSSIEGGVNFAVSGAAAVDSSYYEQRGIINTNTNYSLGVQISWFNQVLTFFCDTPSECKERLKNSLFVLGPFGSNDYRNALNNNIGVEDIRSYVPVVVGAISAAINDLITFGAKTIIVPGTSPDGCLPSVLTDFGSDNQVDYDPNTGCITWMNELNQYHNSHLQQQLYTIRRRNPDVVIIYADFYNVVIQFYRSPKKYGFVQTLVACCGGGGKYNFSSDVICGDVQVNSSCGEPWFYINWDGYHTTERANKLIFNILTDETYTSPPINNVCASSPELTYCSYE